MKHAPFLVSLIALLSYQLCSMEYKTDHFDYMEQPSTLTQYFNEALEHLEKNQGTLVTWYVEKYPELKDFQDRDGRTLLMHAACYQNLFIAQQLISMHCNVTIQDNAGNTALHYAAQNNHSALAQELLKSGANIHSHNNDGHTPFDYAAQKFTTNNNSLPAFRAICPDFLKILILYGAHVNPGTHKHCFNGKSLFGFVITNNREHAENLLKKNHALANEPDSIGATPLMYAATQGNKEMVELLLDYGATLSNKQYAFVNRIIKNTILSVGNQDKNQYDSIQKDLAYMYQHPFNEYFLAAFTVISLKYHEKNQ